MLYSTTCGVLWAKILHPELARKYSDVIFQGYKWLDQAIKKILDKADDDTTIVLVSDHGFGPLKKIFYLNRWLMEKGLLKLNRGRRYSFHEGPQMVSGSMPKDSSIRFQYYGYSTTVLYLLGEPVPKGMDGRVLREVIRIDY